MRLRALFLAGLLATVPAVAPAQQVPLSAIGRFEGWRENSLIGYGLVTGLAGSGDTRRNEVTRQALKNALSRLGTTVTEEQISSRNVAVVIVVGRLPASANVGDKLDVTVSSIGDARSLAGGTLLMTPMMGPDGRPYALAQGPLVTGGHSFESDLSSQQRNYPTTALLQGGATVEREVDASIVNANGTISFLLNEPNFATASRIASAINSRFGGNIAVARNADQVQIRYGGGPSGLAMFAADIQSLYVEPERSARVVINERTGTVVGGGDVMISSVVISQGDIRVTVTGERYASQPSFIDGFARDIRSLTVSNTRLDVDAGGNDAVIRLPNTSVADLVEALSQARVSTRRQIAILQAIKAAGALHAELVIQ